jgi:hypothetical protein
MKLASKQTFVFKIILGVILAHNAGNLLSLHMDPVSMPTIGGWKSAFTYTIFPLVCIVIVQWILLSDHLPKWWVVAGFIGCTFASFAMGATHFIIPAEIYLSHGIALSYINNFLIGILVALPQWFLLGNRRGYLWVLANGIGWIASILTRNAIFSLPFDKPLLPLKTLFLEVAYFPLGLALGLYLYSYIKGNAVEQKKVVSLL